MMRTKVRAVAPCRLCLHVVAVVGLEHFSDLWGCAGRATRAWQAQNEISDYEGHGSFHRGRRVEVDFRDASVHQTWLHKWTSDGVTSEKGPKSLKKAKLELAQ